MVPQLFRKVNTYFYFNEKEFLMKLSQKPEWLEPNDDAKSHRKVSRGVPVLALVAAATLIGVGAIFAQPQAPSVANTEGSVAVLNTAQQDSTATTPILNFPAVGTFSDDEEDFYGFYGFFGLDDDDDDEEDLDDDDDEEDLDEDEDEEEEDEEDLDD